jgi:cysteine sulfinate desulfinase/cysteine desulfurase-like protein
VRVVDFDPETGLLDLDDFQAALEEKPRLVAVGYASNALGTVNPLARLVRWAKEAGALTYIDAVQYAPHGPIDVQQLAATSWCARPTSSLARTWACCTAAMTCSRAFPPTACARPQAAARQVRNRHQQL